MQTKTSYSPVQIALHWAIAVLIILNYIISDGMPEIFDGMLEGKPVTGFTPAFHVYAGMAVMILAVLRLGLRRISGAPVPHGEGLMDLVARWTHRALYLLMIAVPALGAISWYGGIDATAGLHVLSMNAMMILALAHAAAALFHQYVLKDGLLLRMTRTD